jgi:N6-L-threonylcarbamoyladenine synthase
LAVTGDPRAIKFPRPLLQDGTCNFSFSGLKTAVLSHVRKNPGQVAGRGINDLCASFQAAVCDVLSAKTAAAVTSSGIRRVVAAGGVACNSGLRNALQRLSESGGFELYIPSPGLCSDNAAMLAVPGNFYLTNGIRSDLTFDALPVWPLDTLVNRLKSGV